jgi:hypothetical protein
MYIMINFKHMKRIDSGIDWIKAFINITALKLTYSI